MPNTKAGGSKKTKSKGPIPIPPEIIAAHKESVIKGLKKAARVVGPMAAAAVAGLRRKPEARMDLKGARQISRSANKGVRANRLEGRAEEMSETNPMKAAKLQKRSANLKKKSDALGKKGAANQKAAKVIYDSKAKPKKTGKATSKMKSAKASPMGMMASAANGRRAVN